MIHPLQFHGITSPAPGSNRAHCPRCSHTRRKHLERCLQVDTVPGGWDVRCKHCGWTEWVAD